MADSMKTVVMSRRCSAVRGAAAALSPSKGSRRSSRIKRPSHGRSKSSHCSSLKSGSIPNTVNHSMPAPEMPRPSNLLVPSLTPNPKRYSPKFKPEALTLAPEAPDCKSSILNPKRCYTRSPHSETFILSKDRAEL